jgi:hypothetical protein
VRTCVLTIASVSILACEVAVVRADELPIIGASTPAAVDTPSARALAERHFQLGLELGNKKQDWEGALAEFLESRRLFPTRSATRNAAIAYTQLGRYVEALDMYDALLRDFTATSPPSQLEAFHVERRAVRERVAEIEVRVANVGATLVLDGKLLGTVPLAAPLLVEAGSHILRVSKDGFETVERQITVRGGRRAIVDVHLLAQTGTGFLEVGAKNGGAFDVVVDSVVVGQTPWRGSVAAGRHSVLLRLKDRGSLPVAVDVKLQGTSRLELDAVVLDAKARVEPWPPTATVFVDGVFVGNGAWQGALQRGRRRFEVVAPGHLPFRRDVQLEAGTNPTILATLSREPPLLGLFAEPSFGLVSSRSLRGGTDTACDCSDRTRPLGWIGSLRLGYNVLPGLALELSGGYLRLAESSVRDVTSIKPEANKSTFRSIDFVDSVVLSGPFAAVAGSARFFERIPLTVRFSVGAARLAAELSSAGTFKGTEPAVTGRLDVDEGSQQLFTPFASTELRLGYRFTRHVSADLGLALMLLVPPDAQRTSRSALLEIPERRDVGVITIADEAVARTFLAASPSIGARFEL